MDKVTSGEDHGKIAKNNRTGEDSIVSTPTEMERCIGSRILRKGALAACIGLTATAATALATTTCIGRYKHTHYTPDSAEFHTHARQAALLSQASYYFSPVNLQRDEYLRQHMQPGTGFVPLQVLLNFPRISRLQTSVAELADLLQYSASLELNGPRDAVRARHGWERFMPSAG